MNEPFTWGDYVLVTITLPVGIFIVAMVLSAIFSDSDWSKR